MHDLPTTCYSRSPASPCFLSLFALATLCAVGAAACSVDNSDEQAAREADEADAGQSGTDPIPANACQGIAPQASPAANHETIQGCLDTVGEALLLPGEFPIATGLTVPPRGQLVGIGGSKATLILQPGNTANFMVRFAGDSPADQKSRVANLRLDANNAIGNLSNSAIVTFSSDNNVLEDCELFNGQSPPPGRHSAGAYVICDTCEGNEILRNDIHDSFYGIIFRGKSDAYVNVADANQVHNNKCDPLTFAGFGVATNNHLYENGWDCENGPIPGGGIYSLANSAGGVVRGNTVSNACGHGIDIDRASNFVIEDNVFTDPGYQFGGFAPWCTGASAGFFIDLSDSIIRNNQFLNNDRATNRYGGDFNGRPRVFQADGAAPFSDLPHGANQAIAFVLAKWPDNTGYATIHNTIENNVMRANCSGDCVGLGYFASRGTGFYGTAWTAGTTSYYRGNNPVGSQVGSKRCGGNWYAADTACAADSAQPCNIDDFQHQAPAADFARNDLCSFY